MPNRTLRFCPKCQETQHAAGREACRGCGAALLMLLDGDGALAAEFLASRGSCCDTGCRNCPYPSASEDLPNPPRAAQPKICGKCGKGFECGNGGCWCEALQLTDATLKWLSRAYADCLCPECLREFAVA